MQDTDIIISLWRGGVNTGEYVGCGVCMAPELILTAKHVAEQLSDKSSDRAGNIPGRGNGVSFALITHHSERDISLITLSHPHGKSLVECMFNFSSNDTRNIDLLAWNTTENCLKGPFSASITNWTEPGGWEFHTQPSPGMSGGAALLNGKLVGIIQARDKHENSGIIIPLSAVKSFIQQHCDGNKEGSPVPRQASSTWKRPCTDGSFLTTIRQNIQAELDNPSNEALYRELVVILEIDDRKGGTSQNIASKLLELDIHEAIVNTLTPAISSCIYPGGGRYDECLDKIPLLIKAAEQILGWLVLSCVDEQKLEGVLPAGTQNDALYFVLGHHTLGGVELVVSRLFERKSEWSASEDPTTQGSRYTLPFDSCYFCDNDDVVVQSILLEIWNKVFDTPEMQKKGPNAHLKSAEIKLLNATLTSRRKKKKSTEHYYITFESGIIKPERVQRIFNKLLGPDYLKEMTVIEFGSQHGKTALLLDEFSIIAAINEFYRDVKNSSK